MTIIPPADATAKVSYQFVELGEGHSGDFDPADPQDEELLRLDAIEGGQEVESLCTSLPVSTPKARQYKALQMVEEFARAHPDLSPRKVTEVFSYMDETWIDLGAVPANVMKLFGLWSA